MFAKSKFHYKTLMTCILLVIMLIAIFMMTSFVKGSSYSTKIDSTKIEKSQKYDIERVEKYGTTFYVLVNQYNEPIHFIVK